METIDAQEALRQAPLKLIAARIRRARRASDEMSLDTLAEAAGTSRQHLINLEHARHRPRLDMLERIAQATGKPLNWFLVEDEDPNPFPGEAAA